MAKFAVFFGLTAGVPDPFYVSRNQLASVNRLALKTLQLQVLEMVVVLPGESWRKFVGHAGLSSRSIAESQSTGPA